MHRALCSAHFPVAVFYGEVGVRGSLNPKLSMSLSTAGFNRFLSDGGGVDFRLNEDCWLSLCVGDVFEFVEDPSQERRYSVRILALYKEPSFGELIDSLPDALFEKSEKQAYLEFFSKWWSAEDQEREGTLALHIEVL